jgi:hypothetical protein
MNRSQSNQNQIATKLLSSKFLYSKVENLRPVKKLTIQTTIKTKNPEVGSATINILFGRRPSFTRALRRHDREYRLIHLTLTAHKKKILTDLDLLAYTILPFQLANQMAHIRSISGEETSWTLENCTPASPLHPLLFPYPISDERFTLTIILGHKRTALPIVTFYLNFFQLPISIL